MSQTIKETFPLQLKTVREMRKMTQAELSKRIGLKTNTSVAQFETGERLPSVESLAKLAAALNVTADYLLGIDNAINLIDLTDGQLETLACLLKHWRSKNGNA